MSDQPSPSTDQFFAEMRAARAERHVPMYAVSAHVTIPTDDGFRTAHLPTFYLMTDVQGIVSEEHATRIARRMIMELGHAEENVYVHAVATSANAH